MIPISEAPPSEWTGVMQNVYSQFGEDGVLQEIFRRIGTTNKQCFECGAADGKWFSNSRNLIDQGWKAALIEADPSNWPELDKLDGVNGSVVVHGTAEAAGPYSLDSILSQCEFDAQPDLGVIDVDGQDYYLWNGMMKFLPRVMVVEHAPEVPRNFVPDKNGVGQASFAAVCSVAVSKGYFNVCTTYTNGIYVRNDLREKFLDTKTSAPVVRNQATIAAPLPAPPERIEAIAPAGIVEQVVRHEQKSDVDRLPAVPMLATGTEQEIKIATIVSRPRFGLNVFFDCASEGLSPWHIPLRSFYGVFWGQHMQTAMEDALNEGIDWILTLDYDTMFTAAHLQKLIDALGQNPEIDGIAALQVRRGRPLPLAVGENGKNMPMTGTPAKVRTAHFGLTILRAEMLRKMPKPWFWSKPAPDGSWGEGHLDDDIYFWANWGDSGNSLYVHTGCRIGHVEEMVAEYDEKGSVQHTYISAWRKRNGHSIKSFE